MTTEQRVQELEIEVAGLRSLLRHEREMKHDIVGALRSLLEEEVLTADTVADCIEKVLVILSREMSR